MPAPLHRCLAVWLAATAVSAGLVTVLLPVALTPASRFDELLVRTCAIAGSLVAAWLWVVTTAVAVEARRGRSRVPVPAAVRRVLLASCGAARGGAAPQPAVAVGAAARAGLPRPPRPQGGAAPPRTGSSLTVHPGDTLWSLAEDHLGSGDRWPEIYALNRAVVGADPDVIQPAQRLRLPAKEK